MQTVEEATTKAQDCPDWKRTVDVKEQLARLSHVALESEGE
jgi:hypothetical protein